MQSSTLSNHGYGGRYFLGLGLVTSQCLSYVTSIEVHYLTSSDFSMGHATDVVGIPDRWTNPNVLWEKKKGNLLL